MKHILSAVLTFFVFNSFSQNALNFIGGDDVVQTSYSGVTGTANRTFEAWIYVPASAPSSNLAILDYGLNAAGSRNTFYVTGSKAIGFISGGTNANIGSPANSVPTNQWTHVAFVLNSGAGYLYVNGIQVGTGSLTSVNTPAGNSNMKIGQRVSGGSIPFVGSIDDVRVWSVARSAAQITADMNIEYCLPPTGLAAYYKLNEGVAGGANATVLTAVDEISANNGTLTGFALTGASSNWVLGSGITLGPIMSSQNVTQCPGTTLTVGSNTYTTAGLYNDTLIGQGTNGCDSVVVTNFSFYGISNDTTLTNICMGDSATIDGVNYFSSAGFYGATLTSTLTGCDSIVTINLVVNLPSTGSQSLTECEGYILTVGTSTYSTTGVYIDTLTNAAGCDSILTSTLTILTPVSSSQIIDLCGGESIAVGSNVYSVTGNYVDTLVGMAISGCDSIVMTNLTVSSPIDVIVNNNTSTFTISANNGSALSYQWIDCNAGADLAGETGQSLLVTANGSYAVVIAEGNCTDTSLCETYSTIGIEELEKIDFNIYPNPSNGKVTLTNLSSQFGTYDIRVINLLGQTVYSKTNISSATHQVNLDSKGVYFFEMLEGKEKLRKKLIIR